MGLGAIKRMCSREPMLWTRLAILMNDLPAHSKVTTREAADRLDATYDEVMEALQEFERQGYVKRDRLPHGGLLWYPTQWLPTVDFEPRDDAAFMRLLIQACQFIGQR